MYQEKKIRSILKTFSWRLCATLTTIIISYLITGDIKAAQIIGSIEAVAKILLYYFHERIWSKLNFGRITL